MSTGLIIDGAIVLVVVICALIGYARGLVHVIVGIVAFILSLVVTLIFYRPIANLVINNTQVDDKISEAIYQKIKDEDVEESENEIIKFSKNYIIENAEETTTNFIAKRIGETTVEVVTFILLIIGLRIACFIITIVFSIIADLPIIKQLDKTRRYYIWSAAGSSNKFDSICTYTSYSTTY